MGTITHGTNRGYAFYKCRCDACREAHAEAARKDRERRADKINAAKREDWASNPQTKVTRRQYIEENRDRVRELKRASYHRNREANIAKLRERYAADPEKYIAKNRAWAVANPDAVYGSQLRRKYGITIEEYYAILDVQGGVCAICGTDTPGKDRKRFHVDHNHETGAVRGLLCHGCNTGIGHLKENADVLRSAIRYLMGEL